MKTKLVLWGQKGSEEAPEKVLLALALNAEQNKVESWIFEEEAATEEFFEQLMENWRKNEDVPFPENHTHTEFELSAGGDLLPEGIVSTEKDDLIKRTQTSWLFIVLSTKLFKTYESELEEIRDRIDGLGKYDKAIWEELKEFQNKMHAQFKEGNIFREHTNRLRERLDELFGFLKSLREVEDRAYESMTKAAYEKIVAVLITIEDAVANSLGEWGKWFDKLKELQQELKNVRLTRDGRNELWERIDKAFKEVKDRKFGGKSANTNTENTTTGGSHETRLQRRMDGLRLAIKKMQDSVNRDEKELSFQDKKINSGSASQLETQLREVKSKMLRERLDSKKEKLDDMEKTLTELEERLANMLAKQAKEEAKKAEKVDVVDVTEKEEVKDSNEVSSDEVVAVEEVTTSEVEEEKATSVEEEATSVETQEESTEQIEENDTENKDAE